MLRVVDLDPVLPFIVRAEIPNARTAKVGSGEYCGVAIGALGCAKRNSPGLVSTFV